MTVTEATTLCIAVLGAVLGVINTWHSLDKVRVKLVVRPRAAIPVGAADPRMVFCIEVTNLSNFAVTVSEIGVFYHGTSRRGAIVSPMLVDGGGWPRRLEARSSVTLYAQNPALGSPYRISCAYATTECGVTVRGNSPALQQIARGET
jgi:hypothetical protein